MPIVTIEVIGPLETINSNDLTQKLANELGKIFDSAPGSTWVKVQYLDKINYAENDVNKHNTPSPIFVSILKRKIPSNIRIHQEIDKLSTLIANVYNRKIENVHLIYEPSAEGRIAFGGKLLH